MGKEYSGDGKSGKKTQRKLTRKRQGQDSKHHKKTKKPTQTSQNDSINTTSNMEKIPDEILLSILHQAFSDDLSYIRSTSLVNRRWFHLSYHPQLWKQLEQQFGLGRHVAARKPLAQVDYDLNYVYQAGLGNQYFSKKTQEKVNILKQKMGGDDNDAMLIQPQKYKRPISKETIQQARFMCTQFVDSYKATGAVLQQAFPTFVHAIKQNEVYQALEIWYRMSKRPAEKTRILAAYNKQAKNLGLAEITQAELTFSSLAIFVAILEDKPDIISAIWDMTPKELPKEYLLLTLNRGSIELLNEMTQFCPDVQSGEILFFAILIKRFDVVNQLLKLGPQAFVFDISCRDDCMESISSGINVCIDSEYEELRRLSGHASLKQVGNILKETFKLYRFIPFSLKYDEIASEIIPLYAALITEDSKMIQLILDHIQLSSPESFYFAMSLASKQHMDGFQYRNQPLDFIQYLEQSISLRLDDNKKYKENIRQNKAIIISLVKDPLHARLVLLAYYYALMTTGTISRKKLHLKHLFGWSPVSIRQDILHAILKYSLFEGCKDPQQAFHQNIYRPLRSKVKKGKLLSIDDIEWLAGFWQVPDNSLQSKITTKTSAKM